MTQFTSFLVLFITAFACFFGSYKFFRRSDDNDEYEEKLEKKINEISVQQEKLLENIGASKISTFTKASKRDSETAVSESVEEVGGNIQLLMKKAGITDMTVKNFTISCTIGGFLLTAILIHFNFLHPVLAIPVGMFVGAYLAYNILAAQSASRKMQFLRLFPDAIDMMVRGVKAGLNVGRIIKLVSIESKEPIAGEFATISQKFDLGIEPEKVLVEAAEKIDIEEFRFLVVALVLQMENGGVLVEILQNLSGIVRKRLELGLKLKALSAEARMSAIVISALPFVFAGIMLLVNPDHLKELTAPGMGQNLLRIGITLFSIGAFMMIKASKIKV
ncbi:MAG: type II secretion system F family protein [Holosporaceae bacterium]|jgi:tight adherence protein B|nr:type II secretion system F family protein [Holosporaceae bacterium]